ncbi:MAG: DUF1592 domain-containing protein [Tepidisphaeraceae bacterium]
MCRPNCSLAFCVFAVAVLFQAAWASAAGPSPPSTAAAALAGDFRDTLQPLLTKYCYECHGDGASSGDIEFDSFRTGDDLARDPATWKKAIANARGHIMPPPEAEHQPTQDERDKLVSAINRQLYRFDPTRLDPGRVTLRRLNRVEYRNTIRDLVGVGFDPTIDFPQDDTGYGFDNIADVLTLPPMLMEKYLASAEKILDEAIPTERIEQRERRIAALEARASFERRDDRIEGGFVSLSSEQEDALSVTGESPAAAEYRVRVLAYAKYAEPPPPGSTEHPPMKLSIMLSDAVVREVEVSADHSQPQWYEARMGVPAGRHVVRVAVRRERGIKADKIVSGGRVGNEQPGEVAVKEIIIDGPLPGAVQRLVGDRLQAFGSGDRQGSGVVLNRTGDEAAAEIDVPSAGKYVIRIQACADYAGDEPAKMELLLDGKALTVFDVAAPARFKPGPGTGELARNAARAVPQVYTMETKLTPGKRRLVARYLNNLLMPDDPNPNYRDRNVLIDHFEIVELSAPLTAPPMTESMRTLFARHTAAAPNDAVAAQAVLADFSRRAWRRPSQPQELDRLIKLFTLASEHGESFQGSVKHAMKAVLVSPSFLFRGEIGDKVAQETSPVGEYELASRLSYFLWSTMPDDVLLDLAARGELRKSLDQQVKRMLASPRSAALVENFAGQWLQFRNLDAAHPDEKKFKEYSDRLRDAMKTETRMFFESILREDRSLMEVLTADYTFVNERLAKHYGINGVKGDHFRRVSLTTTPRRGVLTQGSVLTLTSNPTRTSPVKRGKWVLENLLGTPPPPPPPDVPPLESEGKSLTGTLRQRLEKHRADPGCASCHAAMDPIGLALENFDAIGRWRDKDGKDPIDATASFVNGPAFTGAAELTKQLADTRQNDYLRAVTEASLTFALGRGVEPADQPAVEKIVAGLRANDLKFSSLVLGVVNSVPFQMRRAGSAPDESVKVSSAE